jgi:hypothetical protein
MTLFPLMDCCAQLAIDPKTLRRWLEQATMSWQLHPLDGRRKCLTGEQVQQLAAFHGRQLVPDKAHLSLSPVQASLPNTLEEALHPLLINDLVQEKIPSAVLREEEEVSQKLSHLQAQVVTQQQQLALLTQALLQERAWRNEQALSLGVVSAQPMTKPDLSGLITSVPLLLDGQRPLHPAEQRARLRVLPPLIEYGRGGTYVVLSSQEGEISLIPDSPEWFEWFRTLSSFRFVGKSGYFSACRGYKRRPTRIWQAYRTIHQRDYKRYLGLSEHLTIAHLEQMAAKFQILR